MAALLGCEVAGGRGDPDAFVVDAGQDAARTVDVGADAGPTHLAPRGAARLVDDCGDAPLLAWNGEGWGLTWRSPSCAPHVRELAIDGTPLASLPIPALPPAELVATTIDTFSYAHGAYAIDASSCALAGGEYCGSSSLGALARDGSPLAWVASGGGVLAAAGSAGDGWLTLEKGPTMDTPPLGAFFVVARDAALHEVARSVAPFPDTARMLSSYGLLARGPHAILASWSRPDWASAYQLLGLDGAPLGAAFVDGAARAIAPWGDDFLVVELEQTPPGLVTIDLVVIGGAGAGVRARTTVSPGGASHVAFLPERGLVALCWLELIPEPTGVLDHAVGVQLADVASGTLVGPPEWIRAGMFTSDVDCASDGSTITVAWSTGGTGTFVEQLDVLR